MQVFFFRLVNRVDAPYPGLAGSLTVFRIEGLELIRVGATADGGYIIADLGPNAYDFYLGGGIRDDTTFDNALAKHHNINGLVFDASIDECPPLPSGVKWIRKFIGFQGGSSFDDLTSYLSAHQDIFMKIDIENAEWDWFKELDPKLLQNVKQMTMEVHYPCGDPPVFDDRDERIYRMGVLEKLAKTHYLIWAHGNNWQGVCNVEGTMVPIALELTYIRKDAIPVGSSVRRNTAYLPTALDLPNRVGYPDILLNYPPFSSPKCARTWG